MNTSIVTILAAAAIVVAAQAQSLVNGSFEAPGHGDIWQDGAAGAGYGYNPPGAEGWRRYISLYFYLPGGSTSLTGWSVGGGGVYYWVNNLPRSSCAADGHYALNLCDSNSRRGGSISQAVSGLVPDRLYYVFFDSSVGYFGPQTLITVKFGSQTKAVQNTMYGAYQTLGVTFTATAATQTLTLSAPSDTGDAWIFIDNVRLSEAANAPVQLEAKHVMGVQVEGVIGKTYRVEYHTQADRTDDWVFLKRVTIESSPTWVYDEVLTGSRRFYRSVEE